MEAILPRTYMVIDIATDALVEGAWLDGDPAIAVASTEDSLVASFASEVSIPLDPVRSILKTYGVELIDIGWAPGPTDISTYIPVLVYLIVSC